MMPGHSRPYTSALVSLDVKDFDMLEQAFAGAEYKAGERGHLSKRDALLAKRDSVPTTYADIPSEGEEASEETVEARAGAVRGDIAGNATPPHDQYQAGPGIDSPHLRTPPRLIRQNTGLPPTPPTMTSSDIQEPRTESLATNVQFADAVREALNTQRSALSTPGRHLPTPDPSPPGTSENLASATLDASHLRPLAAHRLRPSASSRAESFHTARENTPTQNSQSLAPSPAPQPSVQQWLDASRGLRLANIDLGLTNRQHEPLSSLEPAPGLSFLLHAAKRHPSPYNTPYTDDDLERHISYISNDENPDALVHLGEASQITNGVSATSWFANGDTPSDRTSAEDINNEVYRQIQEENARRHSMLSDGTAVPAGISVSTAMTRRRTLKRTARHESLRTVVGTTVAHRNVTPNSPRQLRHKAAQLPPKSLESSAFVGSNGSVERAVPLARNASLDTSPIMPALIHTAVKQDGKPRQHSLHRVSHRNRLENSITVRRLSDDSNGLPPPGSLESSPAAHEVTKRMRHTSRQSQIGSVSSPGSFKQEEDLTTPDEDLLHPGFEPGFFSRHNRKPSATTNDTRTQRGSMDTTYGLSLIPSSPRKSFDVRMLHPSVTPMSTSQWSDRTEVEVCEAKGVNIYPHHNESVLVVQHTSRPVSKAQSTPSPPNPLTVHTHISNPSANANYSTPAEGQDHSTHAESPLTNPRVAPNPPALKVIPPTPSRDLERDSLNEPRSANPGMPQRSRSLLQRARRFSESFTDGRHPSGLTRTFSLRRAKPTHHPSGGPQQNNHLSPLWQPRRFWEGYDTDVDVEDYVDLDGVPFLDRLPPGQRFDAVNGFNDNGNPPHKVGESSWRGPRKLSVRMPGFRRGREEGFLVGNSLSIERHGTNVRRHYVEPPFRLNGQQAGLVRTRPSVEEMAQVLARGNEGWFGRMASGVGGFKGRMSAVRRRKEEREAEARRKALREQIVHANDMA